MSYADAHRYRVGVNYAALPVNKPHSEVNTNHRDCNMRFDGNDDDSADELLVRVFEAYFNTIDGR